MHQKIIITKTTTAKPTTPTVSQPATLPGVAPNVTKYAISSDPRSTAYSLTPPASNPASFEIRITHNGQLAAGQLLAYNATKNDKVYYGGDLVLSQSVITIYITNGYASASDPFTITAPDGATISMPSEPWYVTSTPAYAGYHTDPGQTLPQFATIWTPTMQLANGIGPGTYVIHLSAERLSNTADAWEYDGFITVNVVDAMSVAPPAPSSMW